MAKHRANKKPPSRKRYEEEHPTVSFRLDRDSYRRLKEHLDGTGYSFADFVKDALGREESMVKRRVKALASRQTDPSVEDRLRCVEDLVHQIFCIAVNTREYPPYCPHCDNQELFRCEGRETESSLAQPWVITWKCPKCGFFIDTFKRIDPESIRWIDPDTGKFTSKPTASAKNWLKKR
jgi:predicted RNA-binding Zn-ribbon protein involved in translation (DUF1610 family)